MNVNIHILCFILACRCSPGPLCVQSFRRRDPLHFHGIFRLGVSVCCYYMTRFTPLIHIESALEELSAIFMRCAYLADETLSADKVEMINDGGALPSQKLPFVRQRVLEVLMWLLLLCVCLCVS